MITQLAEARLGMVWTSTNPPDPSWLGVVRDYEFVGPNTGGGLVRDSNALRPTCKGVIMKNDSGGVLATGSCIICNATDWPSEIEDATAHPEPTFGVIDPFIQPFGAAGVSAWSPVTTVANGSYCIVIVKGPCMFRLPASSASVTALDLVISDADGRVAPIDATPDNDAEAQDQAMSCVGQVFETSAIEDALVKGVFFGKYF